MRAERNPSADDELLLSLSLLEVLGWETTELVVAVPWYPGGAEGFH